MTILCAQLDDLLFDASPLAMETAARHAEGCPACAEKLSEWNALSETAAGLKEPWDSDVLWPRIERALAAEKRTSSRWLWQVAAAVLLTVVLAGTFAYSLRMQARTAAFDEEILRVGALDDVEAAEQTHRAAIQRLEKLTASKLETADSPLMVSYKEKLLLLDDAIAECQTTIDQNRQNAHLREQLLSMYSEKQRTLQDVLREDDHASNE
jgi:hypothetical protein